MSGRDDIGRLLKECEEVKAQLDESKDGSDEEDQVGVDTLSPTQELQCRWAALRDHLAITLLQWEGGDMGDLLLKYIKIVGTPDFAITFHEETLSILQLAVSLDSTSSVSLLVSCGADTNYVPPNATILLSPLAIAAGQGSAFVVDILLRAGANPHFLQDVRSGYTQSLPGCALVSALMQRNEAMVHAMVDSIQSGKATPCIPVAVEAPAGIGELWWRLKEATTSQESMADPISVAGRDNMMRVLMGSVGSESIGLLEDVLGHFGVDDATVVDGLSLLQSGVVHGNIDVVVVLLTHGMDMHLIPGGAFPLSAFALACCLGRTDILEFMEDSMDVPRDPHAPLVRVIYDALRDPLSPRAPTPPLEIPAMGWPDKVQLESRLSQLTSLLSQLKKERQAEIEQLKQDSRPAGLTCQNSQDFSINK